MRGRVAIVGAGLSGLMAGRVLLAAGSHVVLFDKGRRPGGRASTREHDEHRFDHGAQYFTARDPWTRALVRSWIGAGVVAEWAGIIVRGRDGVVEPAKEAERYVAVPGMVQLAAHLAEGLEVRSGVRIEHVLPHPEGWRLVDAKGADRGTFDRVVVAIPAPQAAPLLAHAPGLRASVEDVDMAPAWAGMLAFSEPLALGFDGAFLRNGPLRWIARDSSKPGRPAGERWVAHASPEWTRTHWDTDRGEIPGLMLDALSASFGPLPPAGFGRAHRWAYALAPDRPVLDALFDEDAGIGACGDWCRAGRIEGALLSGLRLAERMLGKAPGAATSASRSGSRT